MVPLSRSILTSVDGVPNLEFPNPVCIGDKTSGHEVCLRSGLVVPLSAPEIEGDVILLRLSSLLYLGSCKPLQASSLETVSSIKTHHISLGNLIPGDTAVTLPMLIPKVFSGIGSAKPLLDTIGVEEVESLNSASGGPSAGQCQFACIAAALSDALESFGRDSCRPDLELRSLALHVIKTNHHMYSDFLTVAGCRTRSNSQRGGRSVDLRTYLSNMSNPSCDGDAVTLQALCDALKITVRVVKLVEAGIYDDISQSKRLLISKSSLDEIQLEATKNSLSSPIVIDEDTCASVTSESGSDSSSLLTDVTSVASYGLENSLDPLLYFPQKRSSLTRKETRRLYISQEIHPRTLDYIDSRIAAVPNLVQNRLIWLSHIGDEAHYRYLRLSRPVEIQMACMIFPHEENVAYESRNLRLSKHAYMQLNPSNPLHQAASSLLFGSETASMIAITDESVCENSVNKLRRLTGQSNIHQESPSRLQSLPNEEIIASRSNRRFSNLKPFFQSRSITVQQSTPVISSNEDMNCVSQSSKDSSTTAMFEDPDKSPVSGYMITKKRTQASNHSTRCNEMLKRLRPRKTSSSFMSANRKRGKRKVKPVEKYTATLK